MVDGEEKRRGSLVVFYTARSPRIAERRGNRRIRIPNSLYLLTIFY